MGQSRDSVDRDADSSIKETFIHITVRDVRNAINET